MKNQRFKKTKLALAFFPFLPLIVSAIPQGNQIIVTSGVYGPYEARARDEEITISLLSTYSVTKNVKVFVHMQDSIHDDLNEDFTSETISLEPKAAEEVSFNLRTSLCMSPFGMEISLIVQNADLGTNLKKIEFHLDPKSTLTLRAMDYINKKLVSDNVAFSFGGLVGSGVILYSETYQFVNFQDYFPVDNYYRIDLDSFYFTYSFTRKFVFNDGFMEIDDPYDLFPLVPRNTRGYRHFPYTVIEKDGKFHLKFTSLFVNPNNYNVTTSPMEGYVETSYLYLPPNQQEKIANCQFAFWLVDPGYNLYDFYWTVSYILPNNLIGDCRNSEYCVIGGVE